TSYCGVDSVRADQRTTNHLLAFLKLESHAIDALREAGYTGVQLDSTRVSTPHRLDQCIVQVDSVDGKVVVAIEPHCLFTKVEKLPGLTRVPQANLLALGQAGFGTNGFKYAKSIEHARSVGADLHAGADFP